METTGENGGSFAVDLNENEEKEGRGGGGGGIAGNRPHIAVKEQSKALLAGVSGGQEAVKGHIYVTGNGRNVNRDSSVQQQQPPPQHKREIMLDLVAGEEYLPGQLTESCVISGVCGDHGGLNGFTESFCEVEPAMMGLEGGGGGVRAGEGEGGGPGLGGTTAASCPAVLGARVSAQRERQMRHQQEPREEGREGDTDSGDVTPGEVTLRPPLDGLPCTGRHKRNCVCTAAVLPGPDVNMPNGDVDSPGCCCPEADISYCKPTGIFSSQLLGERLGLCDVDCEEVKVANGGLHIVTTAREPCDWPENIPETDLGLGGSRENGTEAGFTPGSREAFSGTPVHQRPGEDAPASAEVDCSTESPAPPSAKDSPPLGSSAKLPSPFLPPHPNVNGDSPLSEPNIREDEEEDFSDLSLPIRPQTLRTNPNLAVSLSCDATPLSPDDDGGFYFGDECYDEDFRNVLEAGRRQSAPDKLPDLTDQTDNPDPKPMPKRFGIADFFTRYNQVSLYCVYISVFVLLSHTLSFKNIQHSVLGLGQNSEPPNQRATVGKKNLKET